MILLWGGAPAPPFTNQLVPLTGTLVSNVERCTYMEHGDGYAFFRQSPSAVRQFEIDYGDFLGSDDLIQALNVSISPSTTPTLAVMEASVTDDTLSFLVGGGVEGTTYVVEALVTTTYQRLVDTLTVITASTPVEGIAAAVTPEGIIYP